MPTCVSCHCWVRRKREKCFHCFISPPPPQTFLLDDEPMTCLNCETALCHYHTNEVYLRHELCKECLDVDAGQSCSDDEDDYQQLEAGPVWYYSEDDFYNERVDTRFMEYEEEFGEAEAKRIKITVVSRRGDKSDKCSVCLENMDTDAPIVDLPCHGEHTFHSSCISNWFIAQTERQTCPLCNAHVDVVIQ